MLTYSVDRSKITPLYLLLATNSISTEFNEPLFFDVIITCLKKDGPNKTPHFNFL